MKLSGIIFCSVTVICAFAVSWFLFPYAALSQDEVIAARTPVDAELMDDVSVPDFGEVPVFDMVLHYIDSPPLEPEGDAVKVRFQGC